MLKFFSLFILPVLLLMSSCSQRPNSTADVNELLQTDREFSKLSMEKGMNFAFLEYLDSMGVLLRPNGLPIIGKDSLKAHQKLRPDTTFTLSWEPLSGKIAKSGDLGYTYGKYTYTTKDTVEHGTYATFWTKTPEGKWKMALDVGN